MSCAARRAPADMPPFPLRETERSMIKRLALAVAVTLVAACSSGGSDSPVGSAGAGDGLDRGELPAGPDNSGADATGDVDFPSDDDVGDRLDVSEGGLIGSNAELQASGGAVTPVQAEDLAVGVWSSTDDATQCTTTYTFRPDGTFALASLDQRAGGAYGFSDDGGGTEIVFDFERDNLGSNCFGETEDTPGDGVTYSRYANFPDGNTLLLSAGRDVGGFVMAFDRQ